MRVNCCPYCGSCDIVLQEKGYSAKKGLLGIVTFGLVGGLAGLHGSKKLVWRCPQCNNTFAEPAQKEPFMLEQASLDAILAPQPAKKPEPKPQHIKSAPPVVKQRMLCTCGAYNSIYNKACFSCGEPLSLATTTKVPALPNKGVVCACGVKNSLESGYCLACGTKLHYNQLEQIDGQPSFTLEPCPYCNQPTPKKSRKVRHCIHCGKEL